MNVRVEIVTTQLKVCCDAAKKLGDLTGAFTDAAHSWTLRQEGTSTVSHGALSLFQDDRCRRPGDGKIWIKSAARYVYLYIVSRCACLGSHIYLYIYAHTHIHDEASRGWSGQRLSESMGESPLLVAGVTLMVVVLFCICAALLIQRMFVKIGFER